LPQFTHDFEQPSYTTRLPLTSDCSSSHLASSLFHSQPFLLLHSTPSLFRPKHLIFHSRTASRPTLERFAIMPTGQTQLVYKNEKALAPESIRDVQQMLKRSRLGSQIRNHRIVSGIMFFEISRDQHVRQRGWHSYVRYHLVGGEDPKDEGCIAAMHLSPVAGELITLHMKGLWDTRGGNPNVAWCTAFQFQRKIFPSGTNSCSYTAIKDARVTYCKDLLRLFDESVDFERQNWQAVQVCHNSHQSYGLQ
jgi:hypothetical protein